MLGKLNEKQKEAVMHVDGPCLVIAGAGSGKTKVLTTRIAYLIEQGVSDYNILAITFTNKAAREMRERLNLLVPDNHVFVGTFHSFGLKIIRENIGLLGMDKNFTILDSDDVLSLIKKIMKELDIDPKEISPYFVRSKISFIKNELLTENDLDKYLEKFDIIINTIPFQILDKNRLDLLKKDIVIIDLASNPGGVDRKAAKEKNIKLIWALSLPGKVAPVTSAEFIKETLYHALKEMD